MASKLSDVAIRKAQPRARKYKLSGGNGLTLIVIHMASKLTELQVKNAKGADTKYTIAAGGGLTLLVMPDGAKYWRLRYRIGGRPRMISLGRPYPYTNQEIHRPI